MPGASVPPEAALIIAGAPVVWTLGPENMNDRGNYYVLRDGKRIQDASGSKLIMCNGEVWIFGRRGTWWRFITGSWINTNSAVLPCVQ